MLQPGTSDMVGMAMSPGWRFAALSAVAAGMVLATAPPAHALSGPHDFSGRYAPGQRPCIACHTPHRAVQTKLLWNHTLSGNTFTWSDATETAGGTPLPTDLNTWSGPSKLCLSCHDGSVSIGSIYQPPMVWQERKVDDWARIGVGGDLKGNHPVGVPYPYGGVKNTYNGLTTGNDALASGWVSFPTGVKLHSDPSAGGANNKGIECTTCHDAHDDVTGWYLRMQSPVLCKQCHVK